jgi:hypothetical protein
MNLNKNSWRKVGGKYKEGECVLRLIKCRAMKVYNAVEYSFHTVSWYWIEG